MVFGRLFCIVALISATTPKYFSELTQSRSLHGITLNKTISNPKNCENVEFFVNLGDRLELDL